jgi:glycine cleavage system aminomethyltransferase T
MSAAYAHTMGAAAGLAMVDAAIAEDGTTVEVDVAGQLTKATLSRGALHDPSGARMHG